MGTDCLTVTEQCPSHGRGKSSGGGWSGITPIQRLILTATCWSSADEPEAGEDCRISGSCARTAGPSGVSDPSGCEKSIHLCLVRLESILAGRRQAQERQWDLALECLLHGYVPGFFKPRQMTRQVTFGEAALP